MHQSCHAYQAVGGSAELEQACRGFMRRHCSQSQQQKSAACSGGAHCGNAAARRCEGKLEGRVENVERTMHRCSYVMMFRMLDVSDVPASDLDR